MRSKSFRSGYRPKAESDQNPFSQSNASLGSVKVDIRPSRDQISSCFSVRASRLIGVLSIRESVPILAKISDGLFEEKTQTISQSYIRTGRLGFLPFRKDPKTIQSLMVPDHIAPAFKIMVIPSLKGPSFPDISWDANSRMSAKFHYPKPRFIWLLDIIVEADLRGFHLCR